MTDIYSGNNRNRMAIELRLGHQPWLGKQNFAKRPILTRWRNSTIVTLWTTTIDVVNESCVPTCQFKREKMEREYDAGLQGRIDFGGNYSEVIEMEFKDMCLQVLLNLVINYGLI